MTALAQSQKSFALVERDRRLAFLKRLCANLENESALRSLGKFMDADPRLAAADAMAEANSPAQFDRAKAAYRALSPAGEMG